jgi:hypothetical protein
MKQRTSIIVSLQFEGTHSWQGAHGNVGFLRHMHRHLFFIRCKREVSHDDREVEIIHFKREIKAHLERKFPDGNMGNWSCEMLAKYLLNTFGLNYCEVLEDNENGAEIILL